MTQALRESTYPCLAMIVLRQNRMVVVGRREGFIQVCALSKLIMGHDGSSVRIGLNLFLLCRLSHCLHG